MSKINTIHSSKKYISFIDFLVKNIREKEPIEGIFSIKLLTNGTKTILLLGEIHQLPNYKSGCTLIINLLNSLFKNNSNLTDKFNIDFFLELARNPIYVYNKYTEIANQMMDLKDEKKMKHDYTNPKRGSLTNIDLKNMVQIVQIRNWTEPCIMNREKIGKTETRLEGEVEKFFLNRRVCYKDVRYHWIDTNPFLHNSLAGQIINIYGFGLLFGEPITAVSPDHVLMVDYFRKNPQDKIEKKEDLIKILLHDKLIQKEAKKSYIKMEFLLKHFLKHIENISKDNKHINWNNLLLLYTRFTVDAYSFCRLMKEEKNWYKNIILYGGKGHTENIYNMLLDWEPSRDRTELLDKSQQDNEKFKLLNIKFKVKSNCIQNPEYKKQIEWMEELDELRNSIINPSRVHAVLASDVDEDDIRHTPLEVLRVRDIDKDDIRHTPLEVLRVRDIDKDDIKYPLLEARVLTPEEVEQFKMHKMAEGINKKKRKTRRKNNRKKSRINKTYRKNKKYIL